MRAFLYGAATLAFFVLCSPNDVRSAVAAAAGALFEATPFVLAGILAARLFQRHAWIAEYLGCGCGRGPSARSLPAAAAAWFAFGAPVAIARFIGALLAARVVRFEAAAEGCSDASPLGELFAIVPAALLAGAATHFVAAIDAARLAPVASASIGAALGFVAAPCGVGAVAVAGALRAADPVAARAFLCVAGIVDVRALCRRGGIAARHDALSYALLAAALGVVAARHGDALVHPVFCVPLALCAGTTLVFAMLHRRQRCAAARIAPALMLAGALVGAPPPPYRATETTLADLYAGERLTFTGVLVRGKAASAIVRYAITCCRADAAPVAVRLARTPPFQAGTWLRVDGTVDEDGGLRLVARSIERIAPPTDPFIYR